MNHLLVKFLGKLSLVVLAGAMVLMLLLPSAVFGQQSTIKIPRIGVLAWSSCDIPQPFLRGLEEFGYKPGENLAIECRDAGGDDDGFAAAAAELVALNVDVFVSWSQPAVHAARGVTGAIPIVTMFSGDPVAAGLVRSLAKPGGNLTGVSYYATELTAKRMEFLKEIIPEIGTVAVLSNPVVAYLPFEADTKRAAGRLGIELKIHQVRKSSDLATAFTAMKAENAQAVFVLPDLMLGHSAARIASLALENGLPTMAWGGWYTGEGCLIAYSAQYGYILHRLAYYVDRILKGAKPGDLPIEQPTMFQLSINLKTAKALGLEVPQTLLLRADEIIE